MKLTAALASKDSAIVPGIALIIAAATHITLITTSEYLAPSATDIVIAVFALILFIFLTIRFNMRKIPMQPDSPREPESLMELVPTPVLWLILGVFFVIDCVEAAVCMGNSYSVLTYALGTLAVLALFGCLLSLFGLEEGEYGKEQR